MSYQLEPAQMALNKTRQRILIADTVGLGKTLEAGILMSELIARGKGKRILVVTVKSMMTQFQKEMWNRFTIPLVRLDSSRIQSVRAKLPTNYNPFFYYDKTIISVDTLKNDLDYRTHLENAWWDIIVIDEAHNVAKRGDRSSQRSKLASLLANRSDTLIMLTATPHDGKGQSVASLMNMLDPTAIADEENYTKDDIEGLLIRRFKKDIQDQVSGAFKERVITIERCVASAREEAAYDIFADMKLQMDESRTRGKGILFKTSLEKSLFSSPAACIKSIDARLRKLEKKYPDGDMPDIATLKELKAALELISPADFSRYAKLLKLLNSTEYGWSPSKNNDRLVIFTERIETMKYLAENLKKDLGLKDNQLEVMHGGKTVLAEGWKELERRYRATLKDKPEAEDGENEGVTLPELSEGQNFPNPAAKVTEHTTTPPKPHSEASLLSAMERAGNGDTDPDAERRGLGTPATRAAVIEKLVKGGFAERKGKQLIPTQNGAALISVLPDMLTSPQLTAEWENNLTQIAKGAADPGEFLSGIEAMARELVQTHAAALDGKKDLFREEKPSVGKCPRCGSPVHEGKKNYYCSNKECAFVMWKNDRFFEERKTAFSAKIAAALLKSGKVNVKKLYSPKTGKTYDGTIVLADTGGKYVNYRIEVQKN